MAHPLSDTLILTSRPHQAASAADAAADRAGEPAMAGWRRLAAKALVPAAGAGPDWLASMVAALGKGRPRLIVAHGVGEDAVDGIVAVEAKGWPAGYPARVAKSWRTNLTFAGTPLIAAADPAGAVASLVTGARRKLGARALFLEGIEADPALMAAIAGAAERLGVEWRELSRHERAALRPAGADYETWLLANHSRKRRKEFRRLKARLGETGTLAVHSLSRDEPLAPWIDEFLALERSGWKGRRGTAIACDDGLRTMLTQALGGLAARNELGFWKLTLDGRPIAMLFAPMSKGRAWLCKIAHDETLARYSPGVLLILEATRELIARGDIDLVDSCAVPGHPMIEHLWRDRLAIADVAIAAPGTPRLLFAAILAADGARRRLKSLAKSAYYSLLGRRVK